MKPRPVRALMLGFPNVGKSALINRLVRQKVVESARKAGVTRSLRWVRLGQDLDLLDAPGVLPPRLDDQQAALRLALCDDIGQADYDTEAVALAFLRLLAELVHLERPGCRWACCSAAMASCSTPQRRHPRGGDGSRNLAGGGRGAPYQRRWPAHGPAPAGWLPPLPAGPDRPGTAGLRSQRDGHEQLTGWRTINRTRPFLESCCRQQAGPAAPCAN